MPGYNNSRTTACFPTFQHSGIYFPPFAKANGPPFSPERETFRMLPLISFRILIFYAEEKVPHATVIPRLRHTGFYFSPSDKSDGPRDRRLGHEICAQTAGKINL